MLDLWRKSIILRVACRPNNNNNMGLFLLFIGAVVIFVLLNRWWCFWCRSKVCLVGKTAIITGGASGIGYQTALALASKGCRIIIADRANIAQAVEKIKQLTHNTNIVGKQIELSSFKSVREFAKSIIETEPRLHILICNAGIGDYRIRTITEDGSERTMQINYLSHFLLVNLLIDLLKKSAPSRIIFTSSQVAYFSDLSVENMMPKESYYKRWLIKFNGGVYSNSKLAMAAAAKMFADRLDGTGVTANAIHPGIVKTQIIMNAIRNDKNIFGYPFMLLFYLIGKTSEEGAQTLIHLAHSDEVKDVTGQSFIEGVRWIKPFQITDTFCKELWDISVKLIHLQSDEMTL
ncbi:retinol dehydrogenase 12-like [Anthonomus grandis grandis]|uniref:retinol dehydrogenase 12-like n=1 Tax=Anthonomus grandis grandis TaxID=2921223 RepID=UPI0021661ED7|nr:retinol dehydrogenase 12-like [Anthonomus grandis grandis]